MHTRERLTASLRLVCFGILLAATAIRLGSEALKDKPQLAEAVYPTMFYERETVEPIEYDASLVAVYNQSGAWIDTETLLKRPLDFRLSDEPAVLVVQTHATEAYASDIRTNDTSRNVVHIGGILAQVLCENGITAIHDTTLIDEAGYYDAYARASEIIGRYLEKYPSIQMVIDVHRDSYTDQSGTELAFPTRIGSEDAAQLMLVMGTNTAGLEHPNWEENLAFALKLQAFCEEEESGVFRDLNLRSQRYNQHLTPHSVLLEVGSAGNTLAEAERSIRFFAEQLAQMLLRSAQPE